MYRWGRRLSGRLSAVYYIVLNLVSLLPQIYNSITLRQLFQLIDVAVEEEIAESFSGLLDYALI